MSRYTLEGLTTEQVELLDKMWDIDTIDELKSFINTHTPEVQREILVLQEMLSLAYTDDLVDNMDVYPHAEEIIKNILQ